MFNTALPRRDYFFSKKNISYSMVECLIHVANHVLSAICCGGTSAISKRVNCLCCLLLRSLQCLFRRHALSYAISVPRPEVTEYSNALDKYSVIYSESQSGFSDCSLGKENRVSIRYHVTRTGNSKASTGRLDPGKRTEFTTTKSHSLPLLVLFGTLSISCCIVPCALPMRTYCPDGRPKEATR